MGKWILTEDRQPEAYGKYQVMRRVGGGKTVMDEYLWNGKYWVTRKGSPSYAVNAWFDKEASDEPEQRRMA